MLRHAQTWGTGTDEVSTAVRAGRHQRARARRRPPRRHVGRDRGPDGPHLRAARHRARPARGPVRHRRAAGLGRRHQAERRWPRRPASWRSGRSGVDRADIGVLLNTSVCRDYLEPSTASIAHGLMGLPTEAINFDVGNACLGFVNGMNVVAEHDRARRDRARHRRQRRDQPLHDGGDDRPPRRRHGDDTMFREQFATLTLGSGAVAMVLSRAGSESDGTATSAV